MIKFLTAAAIGAMLTANIAMAMQSDTATPPRAPLTKADMLARADARFNEVDTDKNGQLSAAEREAGQATMGGAAGGRGPGAGGQMGERMLARVDSDGNGLISRAEFRAAAEARFARLDVNQDGKLDGADRP